MMAAAISLTITEPQSVFAGKFTATVIEDGREVTYEFDTQEELDAFWESYFGKIFPDDEDYEYEYDEPVVPEEPSGNYDEIPDIIKVKNDKEFANALIKNIKSGNMDAYYSYVPSGNVQELLIDTCKSSKSLDKYVIYNISSVSCNTEAFLDKDGSTVLAYKYSYTSNTTPAQEKKVDKAVADLIKNNNLKNKSDYECIKFVYDYLVDNVSYDNSLSKFSAYNALIEKTSVCSGYSLAFQKIMDALGIPCSCIVNTSHEWNSVYLDGKWYNIDVTWGCDVEYFRYLFFLQDDSYFKEAHDGVSYCTATKSYKVKGAKYSYEFYKRICAVNTRVHLIENGKKIGYVQINHPGNGIVNLGYKLYDGESCDDNSCSNPPANNDKKEDTSKKNNNKVNNESNTAEQTDIKTSVNNDKTNTDSSKKNSEVKKEENDSLVKPDEGVIDNGADISTNSENSTNINSDNNEDNADSKDEPDNSSDSNNGSSQDSESTSNERKPSALPKGMLLFILAGITIVPIVILNKRQ